MLPDVLAVPHPVDRLGQHERSLDAAGQVHETPMKRDGSAKERPQAREISEDMM
jgi:hypothetical protein